MAYLLTALLSYLVGCSNMAFYISKLKKVDLRSTGSGNLGASNTLVSMGWLSGLVVVLHDIGKGTLCVLLAQHFLPDTAYIGAIAGVACVLGHIFPFYLHFRGGKGFAAYLGMTLALNWKIALVVGIGIILVTLITDYIVSGTTFTVLAVPVWLGINSGSWILAGILGVATVVMLFKHKENYIRIYKGTEIGVRSGTRGDHRVN